MRNESLTNKVWFLLVATLTVFTAGCGTMSKEECSLSDWSHVGVVDGRMGKTANYIDEHRKACGQNTPDAAAYEEGRLRGLKDYCTPRSAYNEGSHGRALADVCPQELDAELWRQYDDGRKTYELKVERERIRNELEQKRERIEKDKSVVGDIAKVYGLLSGTSQTQREEERIEDLTDKIYMRDSDAPPGPPGVASLHERIAANPLPAARNLLAISAGSIFGFGIGHSIQGSYAKQGWKWTVIDVANIVGLSITSANCTTAEDPLTGQRGSKNTGVCAGSTLTLATGLIVSRVWQGIEIGRASSSAFSPYQVGVVPHSDGGTLLATWGW